MKKILCSYHAISYWWNRGTKKLDFSGTLYDLLKKNSIKVRKVKDSKNPDLDCYVFTTPHRITYKHFGSAFDGSLFFLNYIAAMGDKAKVMVGGRTFTINH